MKFIPLASVGLLLLIAGAIAYPFSASHFSECDSPLGQLGRALDSKIRDDCQSWQSVRTGGIVGMVIGGAVLLWVFLTGLRTGLNSGSRQSPN